LSNISFRLPVGKNTGEEEVAPGNMSEDDESNLPDAVTAQKLVHEFEGITNTDEALAQFYLQDHDWDLSRALNAYFVTICKDEEEIVATNNEEDTDVVGETSARDAIDAGLEDGTMTTKPPESLAMISWNIDGLAEKNLKKRTKAVCKIIEMEKADIVFLQEVIPETFSYIEDKLPGYHCVAGGQDNYFVATLLRKGRVYCDKVAVKTFPGSRMGRNVLCVTGHSGMVSLEMMNTHLESTKEHAAERQEQIRQCLGMVDRQPADVAVILGGDLNMRDSDLSAAGGLRQGMRDVWQVCGSRKELEHTWDMSRNTNLEWAGRFKPKCRFDRIYLRDSTPSKVLPNHFGLLGLQRITGTQSFPSDHWGLSVRFSLSQVKVTQNKRKIDEVS